MNSLTTSRILAQRLAIAALQGALLWRLKDSGAGAVPIAFGSAALFVPVLAIMAMGNMRRRTYWAWLVVAATLCFGLGFHAGHQQVGAGSPFEGSWNRFLFDLVLAGVLFVGHALVTAGDADRRWIARFPTYFDVSWRQATLLALAGLFVGVFWGVLALGSVLFQAIGIRSFDNTITSDWFWIPATTIATALGLHLIDSRTGMVRGARALVLGLLAWLMPLLSAIGLAFLVALPFTGLQPLWDTRHATSMLLTASIVLILLINSHFQDGGPDSRKPVLLVVTRAIAAVMLTPLVILAAYGLKLRVDQYGWSPSRVESAAVILAVACHAFGYLLAVVRSRTALSQLPATNVASAFIIVLMLLCLLSPIADPARLSVASQLHRLMSGEVSPRGFDFTFLAKNAGRYGRDALETLKAANGSQLGLLGPDGRSALPRRPGGLTHRSLRPGAGVDPRRDRQRPSPAPDARLQERALVTGDAQQQARELRAKADALTDRYRRTTWIRFTLVFFPVPFVVVLLRLQIEAWTYFVFGGAYLLFSALLYVWDSRASARCDAAERLAKAAERAVHAPED